MLVSGDGRALISYLSRWGGLSRSGVRFLEEKGILRGSREGTGSYRCYEDDDFLRLSLFQSFRALDFSQAQSIELCSLEPAGVLDELCRQQEEVRRHYERVSGLIQRALEREADACELDAWRIEDMPTFLALPTPRHLMEDSGGHDALVSPNELAEVDLRWSEKVDAGIGILLHDDPDVHPNVRMTLCELTDELALDPDDLGPAAILQGTRSLRVIGSCLSSQAESYRADEKIAQMAARAGVRATAEGAVGRVLHMQRTEDDDLGVVMEIWAPIAG
jgi:DNA-binding transcriptional MerR regulator